jgi:DNA polymerase-3 subunit gamma/tau
VAEALYRKHRPRLFEDVIGQEHITTTLQNQINTGRIGHAYLFVGSRGCGKTTSARIFAKEINLAGLDRNSKHTQALEDAIAEGRALDVIEIDAASHTSVDDIREIRDKVAFQPSELRYKVYIIDEVHMLSTSAFNALLKTLEEPPPHVIFILATTDPQKIPATVLSRCQRFNFKRVAVPQIVKRLRFICEYEKLDADEIALTLIARHATGALRDAVSLLDQLASSSSQRITANDVREALGATDITTVKALIDALVGRSPSAGLGAIQTAIDQGADARQVSRQLVETMRLLIQLRVSKGKVQFEGLSEAEKSTFLDQAEQMAPALLLRGIRLFSNAINEMRSSADAQLVLEMAFLECVLEEVQPASVNERTTGQAKESGNASQAQSTARPITTGTVVVPSPTDNSTSTSAPVATAHNLPTDLRALWQRAISEVNKTNKPIAALMRSCQLHACDSAIAQIKANHDLARDQLSDPKRLSVVTVTLQQLLGNKITVQVFVGQPPTPTDPNEDPIVKVAKKLGGQIRE